MVTRNTEMLACLRVLHLDYTDISSSLCLLGITPETLMSVLGAHYSVSLYYMVDSLCDRVGRNRIVKLYGVRGRVFH